MSNLSERIKKAKKLSWSHNSYTPSRYGTWGSKDKGFGEKYYRVELSHSVETINTPDGKKKISVLQVSCQKDIGNGSLCNCPGNERHTVCYHGLGALYENFKKSGKLVSFFETYESAIKMSFGGKIAKVASVNGPGFLWATIKEWPKPLSHKFSFSATPSQNDWQGAQEQSIKEQGILSIEENISLMRGSDEDEGID